MGQKRKKPSRGQKVSRKGTSRKVPTKKIGEKKKTRTRVQSQKSSETKKVTKGKGTRNAASQKGRSQKHRPQKHQKPSSGKRAPKAISASVASRLAAAAQQRYVASDLQQGLEWTKGRVLTDADLVARQAIAADIFRRHQAGGQIARREAEWFDGYACPSGRVAAHFSRLRWDDRELDGALKQRLDSAYEKGGEAGLDDAAARISDEMRVPVREVFTLFYSG